VVETLTVPARFCGPDESAHGGWVCGSLAELAGALAVGDGLVEVTLRRPPPLDAEMRVEQGADPSGATHLLYGDDLVAEAVAGHEPIRAPGWITPGIAREATAHYRGHVHHPFPHCFVCGTARAPGDGLRLFPGPVEGLPLTVATPFVPPADLADPSGHLVPAAVWAALDCPAIWPYLGDGTMALLGRMRALQLRPVPVGVECVVVGQGQGEEGRKRFGSAALYSGSGDLLAASTTTWLTIDG
jgi:hypothetical protein